MSMKRLDLGSNQEIEIMCPEHSEIELEKHIADILFGIVSEIIVKEQNSSRDLSTSLIISETKAEFSKIVRTRQTFSSNVSNSTKALVNTLGKEETVDPKINCLVCLSPKMSGNNLQRNYQMVEISTILNSIISQIEVEETFPKYANGCDDLLTASEGAIYSTRQTHMFQNEVQLKKDISIILCNIISSIEVDEQDFSNTPSQSPEIQSEESDDDFCEVIWSNDQHLGSNRRVTKRKNRTSTYKKHKANVKSKDLENEDDGFCEVVWVSEKNVPTQHKNLDVSRNRQSSTSVSKVRKSVGNDDSTAENCPKRTPRRNLPIIINRSKQKKSEPPVQANKLKAVRIKLCKVSNIHKQKQQTDSTKKKQNDCSKEQNLPNNVLNNNSSDRITPSTLSCIVENGSKAHMLDLDRKLAQCGRCDKWFYQALGMEYLHAHIAENHNHNSSNDTSTLGLPQCGHCNMYFSTMSNLVPHLTTIHAEPSVKFSESFQCGHCDKYLAGIKSLQIHIRNSHISVADALKCKLCTNMSSFPNLERLEKHVTLAHPGKSVFQLGKCNNSFLSNHSHAEHGKPNYACGHCNMKFHSRWFVECHISQVHATLKNYILEDPKVEVLSSTEFVLGI